MPSEIAIPFTLTQGGQVAMVSTPNDFQRQHVSALLSTLPGERAVYRNYGTNSAAVIFQDEEIAAEMLPMNINQAFQEWEPGINLQGVSTTTDATTGTVSAFVTYEGTDSVTSSVPSAGQSFVNIGLGGQVTEVIRG